MARIPERPVAAAHPPRARNAIATVGIGIILLFAIVGVVSAGIFLGGKLTATSQSTPTPQTGTSTSSAIARQNIERAQQQATQIVATAHNTGQRIVKRDTASAKKQAAAIVAAARHTAAVTSQRSSGTPSTSPPSATGPSSSPLSTSSQSPGSTAANGSRTGSAGSTGITVPPPAGLSALPKSWLVVAYNATFRTGPGSAGSITVLNRSGTTFSGTARVVYRNGATASAPFSGLAPGRGAILPLNGPAYPGGGYTIQVVNPH